MSSPWMPLYWADYIADTQHLTTIEHGAYLLLIGYYWRNGKLPETDEQKMRVTKMTPKQWKRHGPVLMTFFVDGNHKRIDAELTKVRLKSEKLRLASKSRWDSEKEDKSLKSLESDDANAMQMQSKWNHNQNQNQNIDKDNTLKTKLNKINKINKTLTPSAEFMTFWSAYPNKVKKFEALKAWDKAIKTDDPSTIINGLRNFKFPDDPQFNPHPSTWLNQKRWLDEPTGSNVVKIPLTDEERKAKIREIWSTP